MKYMIHCCPKRLWYVEEYLIPSMLLQGIKRENIIVWNDDKGVGCLKSWYNSCKYIKENEDLEKGIWHLQDDVLICKDFYTRTKSVPNNINIRCGFVTEKFNPNGKWNKGLQPISKGWMSFPCMYIPNKYASEFILWFDTTVIKDGKYKKQYATGKMDDFFFYKYIRQMHHEIKSMNIVPCLVDHIDYLIGGSSLFDRKGKQNRAFYFDDGWLVDELKEKLKDRR